MKKLLLAGLVFMIAFAPTAALAQAQAEEKMLVGEIQNVDESGTEITFTDGTKLLLTPPGSTIRPGAALERGMVVVAVYLEQEDSDSTVPKTQPAGPDAAGAVDDSRWHTTESEGIENASFVDDAFCASILALRNDVNRHQPGRV